MESTSVEKHSGLIFTDAAARKVGDLIRGEGNPNLMLRVYVQGGGCSGLQYGFEFDEQVQDGDTCVENQGVKLLVDPMSVQYLSGARDRLSGRPGRRAVRHPQSQRRDHLRLRLFVFGLSLARDQRRSQRNFQRREQRQPTALRKSSSHFGSIGVASASLTVCGFL